MLIEILEGRIEKSMQDKVIIVTGGSRGIGASIVKTLERKGYNIILNYLYYTAQLFNICTFSGIINVKYCL